MEVDATSFPYHLLGLLIHISEADFVSFDLELSGIPSRLPNKQPRLGGGRLTLEERYAETKEGADRYQILQVGITCARFDYLTNNYVLRPYNINISPLISERLDIEREVTFQSGAVSFLLSNGFDMSKPFTQGVQYLSREEAALAKQKTWDRLDNKNPPTDMQLKAEDVESLDFMRRAREAIAQWMKTKSTSLDITTNTGYSQCSVTPSISRFEKRLVHQLVRAEFPQLVTIGRSECVRIVYFDAEREAENTRRIKHRVKEQIARQTCFRWVFEALAGGNFDHSDPLSVMQNVNLNAYDLRDRYDRAFERLKSRQPVLVGHNMFTDIVYLYRTFVGELPDTLQGFNDAIHDIFPKIIDTKYLATHAEGDLNASPTLEEIAKGLNHQPLPDIVTHPDHSKYQNMEAFHEAGYDSLLTATIMLRLATKLNVEHVKQSIPQNSSNVSEKDSFKSAKSNIDDADDFVRDGREKITAPIPLPPLEKSHTKDEAQTKKKQRNNRRKNKKNKSSPEETQRRFQTRNIFDNLRDMSNNPDEADLSCTEDHDTLPPEYTEESTEQNSWQGEVYIQDTTGWVPIEKAERDAMEMIPPFESDFWKGFGNTLRVFGTEEAVLKIADW